LSLWIILLTVKKKKKLPASKGNAFEMPGILGKKENAFGAAFPAS